MAMPSWGFSDANGNSLARGWQGYEDQARAMAQRYANERGETVSYWPEPGSEDDEEFVVQPEE